MDNLSRRPIAASLQELLHAARKPGASFEAEDLKGFLEQALSYFTQSFGGVGGAAWLVGADGLNLAAKFRFQELQQFDNDEKRDRHRLFLASTAAQGQSRLVEPRQIAGDLECENPTEYSILVVPLIFAARPAGVLEFFFNAEAADESVERLAEETSSLRSGAEEYLTRYFAAENERRRLDSQALDAFALHAHDSLEVPSTAYTLANEIRNLTRCDRVGVAVFRRGKCRLVAISGQDRIDSRAIVVRRLESLASIAARTGQPIICDEAVGEAAPEIREALYEYLEETHAKQLVVVPLTRREQASEGPRVRVIGALTTERLEQTVPLASWRARLDRLTPHAGAALANALEFEWPVFPALGRLFHRSAVRRYLQSVKVSAIVAALVLLVAGTLIFCPADFSLQAPGKLQPVLRRDVFAETDGTVHRVYVKHGQDVAQGELLAELVDHELNVAEAELIKQVQETSQEVANTERELSDAQRTSALERGKITARRATALERLRGLRAQEAFYAEKRRRLKILSPIDGRVATWNVEETLTMRPVRPGQVLMTVIEPAGDWELEVRLPERRLGHVLAAQRELRADLPVTFLVAADPYHVYQAAVREVHLAADVRDAEEGNVVLVRSALDRDDLPALTLGGEVRAKVYCGRRALGYVWFHDVYEFIQSQIVFRL